MASNSLDMLTKILKEREGEYGSFEDVLKRDVLFCNELNKGNINKDPRIEAGLQHMSTKLARMCNNAEYIDNYIDLAGYCLLLADYIQKEKEKF